MRLIICAPGTPKEKGTVNAHCIGLISGATGTVYELRESSGRLEQATSFNGLIESMFWHNAGASSVTYFNMAMMPVCAPYVATIRAVMSMHFLYIARMYCDFPCVSVRAQYSGLCDGVMHYPAFFSQTSMILVNFTSTEKEKGEDCAPAFWLSASVDQTSGGSGFLWYVWYLRLLANRSTANRIGFSSCSAGGRLSDGAGLSVIGHSSDGSALALRRDNSPCVRVMICLISSPAFVLIASIFDNASREESRAFPGSPSVWRRAISPRMAVTMNPALLSFSCFTASMPSITSWGTLIVVICDLAFLYTDIVIPLKVIVYPTIHENEIQKHLKYISHNINVYLIKVVCICHFLRYYQKGKAPQVVGHLAGLLTNNVIETNTMATVNSNTSTPQLFTWLFLASYNAAPDAIPVALRTQADTEEQARNNLAGEWSLTFAAKIRTQCSLRDIGEGFLTLNLYTPEMAKVVCHG